MANSRAAQLVEAGMWLRLSGDHEGARRLFEQALRLEPENARARQLLESGPNTPVEAPSAPVATQPPPAPDYPFAPPPSSTAMDLDWGSATGFAPTPVPFIPPVTAPPPPVPQAPAPIVIDELPPELEIDTQAVEQGSGTLVFGSARESSGVPNPAPTVPEPWSAEAPTSSPTLAFQPSSGGEVPWSVPPPAPAGGTMQFARPSEPVGEGGTMQFARPQGAAPSSTMQFARPADPRPPVPEPEPTFGTMLFAKPSDAGAPPPVAPAGGTMQFARPSEAAPPVPEPTFGTMLFAKPSDLGAPPPIAPVGASGSTMLFAGPVAPPLAATPAAPPVATWAPPVAPAAPPVATWAPPVASAVPPVATWAPPAGPMASPSPAPDIPEGEWDAISSPSAVFELPMINPLPVKPAEPVTNPYDMLAPGPPPSEPKFAPNATSAWDQRSNPGIKISDIAPGLGAALDLVAADRPPVSSPSGIHKLDEVKTLMRGAKDLLGLDDHTGAMDLILKAQELAPNDAEVQALRDRSEKTLEAMFESKLGKLSAAPRVKLKDDEIIWLNLDHRAGFVLAQIDGQVTFEDLFSVSGMSRLDTARILAQLIEEGVIVS